MASFCPTCNAETMARSHRNWLEKIYSWIMREHKYYCAYCKAPFWF